MANQLTNQYTEMTDYGYGITMNIKQSLYKGKSEFQEIEVLETEGLGRLLLLDNLVMTTEKDEFFYHEMISHIPMNSHKCPKDVLVIGGGDGGTIREVLKHDTVEHVVLCEIDGLVVDVCKKYFPTIACELDNPKVEMQIRDGIEYIKTQKNKFDIILIDSTDPMGPGTGLFTEEFYTNVKEALKLGGIMVAQSESPFADKKEIKAMYTLLRKVFPIVKPYVGPVLTYPAGYWSWAFCSKDVKPFDYIDERRVSIIENQAKLYNRDIHKSVFALPNFVKELVK